MTIETPHAYSRRPDVDVIIIGAGFGGISALYHLRKLGLKCAIIEKGKDIGGVWYWNQYPGARTDSGIPSYELDIPECWQTWTWSDPFPGHQEIRDFLDHCDRQIGIREHVIFEKKVIGAQFIRDLSTWAVNLDNGSTLNSKYLICATGVTSQKPDTFDEDLKSFHGKVYFPSNWPQHEIHPEGKDIARSYNTALPMPTQPSDGLDYQGKNEDRAKMIASRITTPSGVALWAPQEKGTFEVSDEEREAMYRYLYQRGALSFWLSGFNDVTKDKAANRLAYDFWALNTRSKIHDARKRDILAPIEPSYPFGVKRPGIDNGYFEQFNRESVDVVDLRRTPISAFKGDGIITEDNTFRHHDIIIPAIGFTTVIENLKALGVTDINGASLGKLWANGIRTKRTEQSTHMYRYAG
ncbi:FAD/NAD(P)-binding domain-containing protein [Penicillium macrosclerotiorum]|uniref:FAD/NAD(P)-binding domain-containing protein n=1 Tax=Penicillium macrosclerotiorum TaxID=303699 RepID=UPI002547D3AD|nr:FAD/NAD(P)-binding domain-containing protein [Penicillium macrosclerotiorum]KAJ5698003.1 FAD/NAD(P)-binding domain-containing protein [Penicillium macrosclerotiorum]